MTVGSTGLTGRATQAIRHGLSFEDQIFFIKHVDEAEKLINEIKAVTEAYNKAAARHGTADLIDSVLAEAEAARAEAKSRIGDAETRAKSIVNEAKKAAQVAINAARSECRAEREKIKTLRDRVAAREEAVSEKEKAIEPLHAEAKQVLAEATEMETNVGKAKALYEKRIRKLEEALKGI